MADREQGIVTPQELTPSPSHFSPLQLTRRDVVKLIALGAGSGLATMANVKLMGSPAVKFLLVEPYRSTILPRQAMLSPQDIADATEIGVGTSYVKGQGGQPPAQLVAQSVSSADIGTWKAQVAAQSGSFLSNIPDQLNTIDPTKLRGTRIVVTDSGYNSATHHALSVPGLLPELNGIMEEVGAMKVRNAVDLLQILLKAPRLWRRFNAVTEVILGALDKTGAELTAILPYILDRIDTDTAFIYKWPPLERVNNLIYIPPGDKHPQLSMPIHGNSSREIFAKRISELGSSMAEKVLEQVSLDRGRRGTLVPIDLRPILPRTVYEQSPDEHPTEEGYTNIAAEQMRQTIIENSSLYTEVRRRAR